MTPQGAGKAVTFPRGMALMSSDPSLIPSRLRSPSWHRQTNPRKAASWERWVSLGSGWKTPAGGMQGSQVTVPAAIGFHLASRSALPGPGGGGGGGVGIFRKLRSCCYCKATDTCSSASVARICTCCLGLSPEQFSKPL